MANNIFAKTLTFGGQGLQPAATTPTVLTVTILASSLNSGNAQLSVAGGPMVNLSPGATVTLRRVDVSQLAFGGALGQQVTIIGGSW